MRKLRVIRLFESEIAEAMEYMGINAEIEAVEKIIAEICERNFVDYAVRSLPGSLFCDTLTPKKGGAHGARCRKNASCGKEVSYTSLAKSNLSPSGSIRCLADNAEFVRKINVAICNRSDSGKVQEFPNKGVLSGWL